MYTLYTTHMGPPVPALRDSPLAHVPEVCTLTNLAEPLLLLAAGGFVEMGEADFAQGVSH